MTATVEVENMITVGVLADRLMIPVSRLIGELMKNGVMVTVNEQIDFETAQIIVEELGLDVMLQKQLSTTKVHLPGHNKVTSGAAAISRPPVVAVMGHVDHGKTSLLDAIRGAKVASSEVGGITQHISAYQVEHNGRKITFLDTPGHEAFAAIREHSAHLTDLAIIVVAADDGVMPQTIEAIRFARKAGARLIIAITKIDKEAANPNLVKQQLSEQQVLVEEWGGDVVVVEVSAKTGDGISKLLDMILLVADLEDLRADRDGRASGLIIEAHIEQGRGPVAHALVQGGILRKGDAVVAGATYGKIRNLESADGLAIEDATPSTPVIMTGFKQLPEFGDEFIVVENEKSAHILIEEHRAGKKGRSGMKQGLTSGELLSIINRSRDTTELNVLIKADTQGSLTSVVDSLKTLDTQEVVVSFVGSGIGQITDNDVRMAASSRALIYGFNVLVPSNVKQLASRQMVSIRLFNIIYELIDDVRAELAALLTPQLVEVELGRLIVRAIFKTTKTEIICGGEVTKGKLELPALASIMRGSEKLAEVEVTTLKRGPVDVKEVLEGEMCGLSFHTKRRIDLLEGDRLELFRREVISRRL